MRIRGWMLGMALAALAGGVQAADLLIHGGPIYTGGDGPAKVEALVVKDGKVAFAGPLAGAKKAAPGAIDIDLKGAAAFPGLVDAHAHLMGIGFRELTLNLEGAASIAELQARLKAWNAAHPGAEPLSGRGWIETHWPEKRFPSRADLDAVVPDRPVVLGRSDGHALVANSRMLALAGITRDTKDPAGGQILRDAAGEPTGMLIDNAKALVQSKVPPPTPAQMREAAKVAVQLYASRGWTGMHSVSVAATDLPILRDLAKAGELPIRVDNFLDLNAAGDLLAHGPSADPTGLVRVDGIKMYMDGALGSRGAALLEPYSDAPGTGLILTPPDLISETLAKARKAHAQVAIHAIGDRGIDICLDGFEAALLRQPRADHRHRLEHCGILRPDQIGRIKQMGVVPVGQPPFVYEFGDGFLRHLGRERCQLTYALKSVLDAGIPLAASSDSPVSSFQPLLGIKLAVTERTASGAEFAPNEAISVEEAIGLYTRAGAYASFDEHRKGMIKPGMLADFAVLGADPRTVEPETIDSIPVLATISGGKVVYEAPIAQGVGAQA